MRKDSHRYASAGLDLVVCPLYAGLNPLRNFERFDLREEARKVVVATNVAETSVTIEGIVYVVDSCFAKQKAYDPERGMESLYVAPFEQGEGESTRGSRGSRSSGQVLPIVHRIRFPRLG